MIARKFLLPLFILLLSAGCAGREPSVPSPTDPPAVAAATPTPAPPAPTPTPTPGIVLDTEDLAGIEITFWHPWEGGPREEMLNQLVSAFNASNPYGFTVGSSARPDLFTDVTGAIEGRSTEPPPDLVVGFNYHALAWGRSHTLVDLAPYIQDPVWGWSQTEQADFYPGFLSQAAPGGIQTGVPFYRTAEILLYNRTWAAELGFSEPPGYPEELRMQACAANAALRADSDPSNDFQGGLMLGYQPTALITWMAAFGGGFVSSSAGERYTFDQTENLNAFTYLRSLLDESCAWTPADVYPHAEFAARRGLFLPTTPAGLPFQDEAMQEAGSSDHWEPIPYPSQPGLPQTMVYGPDFLILSEAEENRLAAWIFIKWITDPDYNLGWFNLTGYFPVRQSGFLAVEGTPISQAAWIASGSAFPADPGWPQVQRAVSDMARSLYAPLNTVNDVPLLALELDFLAEEVTANLR